MKCVAGASKKTIAVRNRNRRQIYLTIRLRLESTPRIISTKDQRELQNRFRVESL